LLKKLRVIEVPVKRNREEAKSKNSGNKRHQLICYSLCSNFVAFFAHIIPF